MDPKVAQLLRKLPLDKETVASLLPVVGRYGVQGAVVLARSYLGPVAVEVERRHAAQAAEVAEAAAAAAAAGEMAATQAAASAAARQKPAQQAAAVKKSGVRKSERPAAKGAQQRASAPTTTPSELADDVKEANAAAPADDAKTAGGAAKSSAPALKPVELSLLGMALTKAVFEAGELALHNPRVAADGKQPEFKLDENGSPPAFSLAHVVAAVRLWRERSPAAASAEARPVNAPTSRAAGTSPARARLERARAERYAAAPRYTYTAPTPNPRVPR